MKKSKLSKSLTTVTPLSKTIALMLFIILPFVGFYLGTKYSDKQVQDQSFAKKNQMSNQTGQQTYVNNTYKFSFKYPSSLENYVLKNENSFSIGYPGPSDVPLFSLDIIKTTKDPMNWWNQEGKEKYSWILNTKINNVAVGEKGEIKAKEIMGQRKSPGGATVSTSLIIIPGKDFLLVVNNNSDMLGVSETSDILASFNFAN